jgi:uncharacterized protein YndB with AHSA1/START domain
MQDTIERTIRIPVNVEVVWDALTTTDGISSWFGDEVEIDLRPGGEARFGWTEYSSSSHAVVVDVERPTRFSYRWADTGGLRVDEGPSTLVEFTLVPVEGGTEVTVLESGFSSLPIATREQSLEGNTSGWKAEMQDLYNYLAAATV